MKSKNGLIEKQLYKIEFDEEGYLLSQSVLIPITKRKQNICFAAILKSRIKSINSRNKNLVLR